MARSNYDWNNRAEPKNAYTGSQKPGLYGLARPATSSKCSSVGRISQNCNSQQDWSAVTHYNALLSKLDS